MLSFNAPTTYTIGTIVSVLQMRKLRCKSDFPQLTDIMRKFEFQQSDVESVPWPIKLKIPSSGTSWAKDEG